METPAAIIEREVRERIRRTEIDPFDGGAGDVARFIEDALEGYERGSGRPDRPLLANRDVVRKVVLDSLTGLGPLQSLMDDDLVEEIWINGPGRVFCAREGEHVLTSIALDQREIRELVERMLRSSGRRLDVSSPFVDATLPDGSRLHVVIPEITKSFWAVNIRKFILKAHRLRELVRLGSVTDDAALFLKAAVHAGLNIVVSGGTQSGKTTLLNCLAAEIPARERVITCEEVFELRVVLPDVVAMQTRQANVEGEGELDLRRLIVEALRMRPDRIIVGEVRQKEAFDLLIALNSGLPGMTSIHSNSAREALNKLATLPLLAGENVSHSFVVPTVATSIDLIVHLRHARGSRRVEQIAGVSGRVEGGVIESASLWERDREGLLAWTGQPPPRAERFRSIGTDRWEAL